MRRKVLYSAPCMFSCPVSQVSELDACKMLRKLFQIKASAQIIERSSWGYSFYVAVMLAYDNGSISWTSLSHNSVRYSVLSATKQFCWNDSLINFIHVKEGKLIVIVTMMM